MNYLKVLGIALVAYCNVQEISAASLVKSLTDSSSTRNHCIEYVGNRAEVDYVPCEPSNARQRWIVERERPFTPGKTVRQYLRSEYDPNQCLDVRNSDYENRDYPAAIQTTYCDTSRWNQNHYVITDDEARAQFFVARAPNNDELIFSQYTNANNNNEIGLGAVENAPYWIPFALYVVSDIYDVSSLVVNGDDFVIQWKCDDNNVKHTVGVVDAVDNEWIEVVKVDRGVKQHRFQLSDLVTPVKSREVYIYIVQDDEKISYASRKFYISSSGGGSTKSPTPYPTFPPTPYPTRHPTSYPTLKPAGATPYPTTKPNAQTPYPTPKPNSQQTPYPTPKPNATPYPTPYPVSHSARSGTNAESSEAISTSTKAGIGGGIALGSLFMLGAAVRHKRKQRLEKVDEAIINAVGEVEPTPEDQKEEL